MQVSDALKIINYKVHNVVVSFIVILIMQAKLLGDKCSRIFSKVK